MKLFYRSYILIAILTVAFSCRRAEKASTGEASPAPVERPAFSADSAFSYIERQVAFGPRVPGTPAQKQCADWMSATLRSMGWEVIVQETEVTLYNGKNVPCINVIGTINPDAGKRLLLAAHWDTRPFADQHSADPYVKFDGADDGASGVGVLLEIARQLQLERPEIGIDILLVDVEDWGEHSSERTERQNTFCLGSQYWAKNPHKPGYTADNGILVDMVGAKGATFGLEGTSMRFAPEFMRKVWDIANQLGHGAYFQYTEYPGLVDDHLYINQITGIPTIDIINYSPHNSKGFAGHWHTPNDNIKIIDKQTLQAVGETVLAVVRNY